MKITAKDLREMDSEDLASLSLAIDAELERRSAKMDGDWVVVEPDGTVTPLSPPAE